MYDAGIYTCLIENSLGHLNRSFQLIVQGRSLDRPVFISKSNNVTSYQGDNITFECYFYSDSSPFVQWFVQRRSLLGAKKNQSKELEFLKVNLMNHLHDVRLAFKKIFSSSYFYRLTQIIIFDSLSICIVF